MTTTSATHKSRVQTALEATTVVCSLALFAALALLMDPTPSPATAVLSLAFHPCRVSAPAFLDTQAELDRVWALDQDRCGLVSPGHATVDFTRFHVARVPLGSGRDAGCQIASYVGWLKGDTLQVRLVLEQRRAPDPTAARLFTWMVQVPRTTQRVETQVVDTGCNRAWTPLLMPWATPGDGR